MFQGKWNIWIDFKPGHADCKAITPEGKLIRTTMENSAGLEMLIIAARKLTACGPEDEFPPIKMKLTLKRDLEKLTIVKEVPLILVISKGQSIINRKKAECGNTALSVIIEVDENIDKEGNVVKELNESEINKVLHKIYRIPSGEIIISLTNSRQNPIHEKNLLNILNTAGYSRVYLSHEPHQLLTVLPRVNSTLFDAFLAPSINGYLVSIAEKLGKNSTVELIIE